MPLLWSPGASHPLPKEAEDFPSFPRGGDHSKYMPLPIYLAWLQPIYYNLRLVFIHINVGKAFSCGENFGKKDRAAAKLISNHKLLNNCSLKKYISEHKCSSKLLSQKIHRKIFFFHKIRFSIIGNNNKFSEYFFFFFFNLYKNEWKEHKFWQ